jgi:hypothetical protein
MRFPLICLACVFLSAATAGAQTPLADPGKEPRNGTGRTAIPEKIGPPLRQGEPRAPDSIAKQKDVVPDLRATNPKRPQERDQNGQDTKK